jgi:hypothetical protein
MHMFIENFCNTPALAQKLIMLEPSILNRKDVLNIVKDRKLKR